MLSAHKATRACSSCRLHLQTLFEHGFASSALPLPRRPFPSTRLRSQAFQSRQHTLRSFSSTTFRHEAASPEATSPESAPTKAAEIESIVRRARRTFGQTLPKDYLSDEEYILYERLYGPPLRETRPDDLEIQDLKWEDGAAESPARNVLMREDEDGNLEEVEYDDELGFSVSDRVDAEVAHAIENDPELKQALAESPELAELFASKMRELVEMAATEEAQELEEEDELQLSEAETGQRLSGNLEEQGLEGLSTTEYSVADQREFDAIQRLRNDLETAMAQPKEEEIDEEYEEEELAEEEQEEQEEEEENLEPYISSDESRSHPHTLTARSGTTPTTIYLPQEQFITPFSELLERTNKAHLTEAAQKAFGGPGLPNSVATPHSLKSKPQKHIGLEAGQHRMSEIEADAYMAAVSPGLYATIVSTLVETRRRLGSEWIRKLMFREGGEGPRVLDAGAAGVGIMAWREMVRAEWEVAKDENLVFGKAPPTGKTTVLTGSDALRHRMSRLLENTTFLPRLPNYVNASNSEAHLDGAPAQGRKMYDIIIAPHTLFPLKEDWRRKHMVENLWSMLDPNGGIMIIIEKGIPRGFEAVAGARSLLLDKHISSPEAESIAVETQSIQETADSIKKEAGMIIAPCTNHSKCPMYPVPGLTPNRKDFCHFEQRYIRPRYLQQVLGASSRNHEDVKYSYLIVRRGVDERKSPLPLVQGDVAADQSFAGFEDIDLPAESEALESGDANVSSDIKFNPLALPRLLLPALKRRGHVTMDVCTPAGKLERWTVPKSFSKQAYRDARKANWGDLWALGAKTRVPRSPRLGKGTAFQNNGTTGTHLKGIRDGKMGKGGKKVKKNNFEILMGREGMVGLKEVKSKYAKSEKRTKGGRTPKADKPITEDDL
ncbi:putative 37s ribosomal protein rsm22 protein [Coleophoma cylindrospora]|uniref:Putative 37s ribosomal protein rsm22 protein n=1 Tax=Coleophoma cylindrospora TaxID=1849047 RepID=A0A3D8RUD5_9HELO|nr:putative 37s ribosomal protein rsm22 protein [Coleophoma cylindrospora]